MNGFFLIDKPAGFTSFDVIAKMRGILHTKKLGHSGTLDPMATGVLPVFAQQATKAITLLPETGKAYEARVAVGVLTDTGDMTGAVLKRCEYRPSEQSLRERLGGFLGEISQVPPMYSAVKVNGQRLYKLAREGKQADVAPRTITINSLEISNYTQDSFTLSVSCGAGTYIRTLAEDICRAAGTLGTLSELRRTRSGAFSIDSCVPLSELSEADDPWSFLQPCEKLFQQLPRVTLDEKHMRLFLNGVRMELSRFTQQSFAQGQQLAVYGGQGFAAVGQLCGELLVKRAAFLPQE